SYFIPTMAGLMGAEGLSQGEFAAALSEWQLYNHGRHLLTLSGWLAALKALTLARPAGGDKRFFMNASRVELRRAVQLPLHVFLRSRGFPERPRIHPCAGLRGGHFTSRRLFPAV